MSWFKQAGLWLGTRQAGQSMSRDKVLGIFSSVKGKQFDAPFADIFVTVGQAGQLHHVLGHSDDGIPLQSCPMYGLTLVLRKGSKAGKKSIAVTAPESSRSRKVITVWFPPRRDIKVAPPILNRSLMTN